MTKVLGNVKLSRRCWLLESGSSKPYDYLVESIDTFYNQKQLCELMIKNGFSNVEYRNLSNGISAIHSGWKI